MKHLIPFLFLLLTACATNSINHMEHTLKDGTAKFCFIGDLGDGSETQTKVAHALKDESCHSIHMVGDLIYPSGIRSVDDPTLEKKFMRYYRPITQSGQGPKLNLVLGNHDHQGDVKAWMDLAKQEPSVVFPHPYYLQNWNGLCIAHLDSNYYKLLTDFFKGQSQISWMKSNEEYMKNQCHTTVALTHHPYKSRGPNHFDAKGYMKEFHEENIVGKYHFLISGHEHILSDEGTVKGTRLLISGAGGRREPDEDYGYLVMEVDVEKGSLTNLRHYFRRVNLLK